MKQTLFKINFIFFFIFSSTLIDAQELSHKLGDLIVRSATEADIHMIIKKHQKFRGQATELKIVKCISSRLHIWHLNFNHNLVDENSFLTYLKQQNTSSTFQFNHLIKMRATTPDDDLFLDQWQYVNDGSNNGLVDADIDADLAWDITTGGLTAQGDTIVVAVLDSGIDTNHEDFGDNLWINHSEIPNNGLDDDNNGYIDDYRGWNILSESDNISGTDGHGTSVAGIVGAQGNNGIGVTGVNWDVKIMVIRNDFQADEASVLAAYTYPLEARIRYNSTNGSEGAYVVATNASWGINFGQPEDAPIWCELYDTMGEAGIIGCGATINGNENVDEVGDLPTACPSDFLIAVTNTNRSDIKINNAGFGQNSIDLGAPGADAFTTSLGNNYGVFGGTSSATPHVAGAIALLYSTPCENLSALSKVNPAAAATMAKQYILDGVDANASLDGITLTGGRLNIFNTLQLLQNNCSPCPAALDLGVSDLTDTNANLIWFAGLFSNSSTLRWRQLGAPNWNTVSNAVSPFMINNLSACTDYEFQINAICDNENSGFTESFIFRSDGCCLPPSEITADPIGLNTATINWTDVLAAESYNLMITLPGNTFTVSDIDDNSFILTDLEPCTEYTVAVQTVCTNQTTNFTSPFTFSTVGCGACLDFDYCESEGDNGSFEWIQSITIADLTNTTGADGGFGDYTGMVANVSTFNSYDILFTPGFDGNSFDEYFKIWIDFNQDGNIDPVDELAFDAEVGVQETTTGVLSIPGDAMTGLTRMRIGMEWVGPAGDREPEPCEVFPFGEVEDYCIFIAEGAPVNCDLPTNLDTIQVGESSAVLTWEDVSDDHSDHNLRYKKQTGIDWIVVSNIDPPYTLSNLDLCSAYEFQVEANCISNGTSGWTDSYDFKLKCATSSETQDIRQSVLIYPNPFKDYIQIEVETLQNGSGEIHLTDIQGKLIYQNTFSITENEQSIEVRGFKNLSQGVYILKLSMPEGVIYKKLMKY